MRSLLRYRTCGPAAMAVAVAILSIPVGLPAQQTPDQRAAWNERVRPFTVIGNVHYVGAAGVSAFLITTKEGSILLDGGLPETAEQIERNVQALGFKLSEVKYLLNSHAHFDHAGGLAQLKRTSGAAFVASAADADALKAGAPAMPAIEVDRVVKDGDTIKLGGVTMTALVTPGHTKGCTTWTTTVIDKERKYRVLFYCSTSVVDKLVRNTSYPGIVADYERTFARLRKLEADVFLANHPAFFAMEDKRTRMSAGGPNPFVDPAELHRYVDQSERQFRAELERQK